MGNCCRSKSNTRKSTTLLSDGKSEYTHGIEETGGSSFVPSPTNIPSSLGRERSMDVLDDNFSLSSDTMRSSRELKENFRLQHQREAILGYGGEEDLEYKELRDTTKTKREEEFIDNCCVDKTLFLGLTKEQRLAIIEQMYRLEIPKGSILIMQGDRDAHDFYVVYEGSFDIFIKDKKVGYTKAGWSVGELALIHNAPRAATVIATMDSKVFGVHRSAFRFAMRNENRKGRTMLEKMLSNNVKEFKKMTQRSITAMIDAFEEQTFEEDEVILKQGEEGDKFYVILTGVCRWTKRLPNGKYLEGKLGHHDYFGEMAIMTEEKRAATITAITQVKTFVLKKKDFKEIIGDNIFKKTNISRSETVRYWNEAVCDLKTLLKNSRGVLGKGAFGVVTLVIDPDRKQSFALKGIRKSQIVKKRQQKHVKTELRVMRKLATLNSKFLVNLITTYKDDFRVYFLLDVCLGGELFTIMRKYEYFDWETARFYVACVVEAFHCMHRHNIIYRDLKPENLVLDSKGYLKVTDFGFAKVVEDKTYTMCGTPDYLAPEILQGLGHDKAVDWWTLGVLTYEMMNSYPPFYDKEQLCTYRKILKGSVKYPRKFSDEVKHFIQCFLMLRPVKRLGMQHNASSIIEKSKFFSGFDYDRLRNRTMKAPIINTVKSFDDMSNFRPIKTRSDNAKLISKKEDFDADF